MWITHLHARWAERMKWRTAAADREHLLTSSPHFYTQAFSALRHSWVRKRCKAGCFARLLEFTVTYFQWQTRETHSTSQFIARWGATHRHFCVKSAGQSNTHTHTHTHTDRHRHRHRHAHARTPNTHTHTLTKHTLTKHTHTLIKHTHTHTHAHAHQTHTHTRSPNTHTRSSNTHTRG